MPDAERSVLERLQACSSWSGWPSPEPFSAWAGWSRTRSSRASTPGTTTWCAGSRASGRPTSTGSRTPAPCWATHPSAWASPRSRPSRCRCGGARCFPAVFVALLVAGIGGFYWAATTLITRDRRRCASSTRGWCPTTATRPATSPPPWPSTAGSRSWRGCWRRVRGLALAAPPAARGRGAGPALPGRAPCRPTSSTSVLYTTAWLAVLVVLLRGRRPDQ